jgi:hypothetical protein
MTKNKTEIHNYGKDNDSFLNKTFSFFKNLLLSLYPDSYIDFCEKKTKDIIKYFLLVFLLIFIISNIILITKGILFLNSFEEDFSKFNNLTIDMNMDLTEDLYYFNNNLKITQEGNYSKELMFISNDKISFKKKECLILPFLCWFNDKHSEIKSDDLKNILEFENQIKNLLIFLVIVLIPIFSLLITIFVMIKTILLILLISFIIKIIGLIFKLKLTFKKLLAITIYASTIYVLIEPFNLLIFKTYYIHLGLFVIYSFIGLFLIGEKKHRY